MSDKPITLVVDRTGLKVHNEVGWNGHKHGAKGARKTWRKLHLALDPDSGDILASELTTEHVGDETALPSLLERVDAPVGRFLADGAYDGFGVSDCLAAAFGYEVDVVVPPPKNAVPGGNYQRNQHIEHIAKHGRMGPAGCDRLQSEIPDRNSDRALEVGHRRSPACQEHRKPDHRNAHRRQRAEPHVRLRTGKLRAYQLIIC